MPEAVVTSYDIKKQHKQYAANQAKWQLIADCIEGEEKVKDEKTTYLPFPIPDPDQSMANDKEFQAKYQVYIEGAHFTNYTEQSVEDLVAGCFRKDVQVDNKPAALDYIDVDDVARDTVWHATGFGRCFVLAEYPEVEGAIKKKDEENYAAYIVVYSALQCINWSSKIIAGKDATTRLVVQMEDEDGVHWIEYFVDHADNKYKIRTHREVNNQLMYTEVVPVLAGKKIDRIPGSFCGSVSNSSKVDRSPVHGIARSNIKHYQTWAELMHVQTYSGHPQVVLSGLPQGWLRGLQQMGKSAGSSVNNEAAYGGEGGSVGQTQQSTEIKIGASRILVLEGETSKAERLLGAGADVIHFKTLEQLEKSMLEQGARIKSFDAKGGVESPQGMKVRHAGESSQLAKIATNAERALKVAFDYAAMYMAQASDVKVTINKEFFASEPEPTMITALTASVSGGQLPRKVLYDYSRETGLIDGDVTDEELDVDLEDVAGGLSGAQTSKNTEPAQND